MNLAQLLEGPADITYKGQTFRSAATLGVRSSQATKSIASAAYGPIGQRAQQPAVQITLKPVGEFSAALAAILLPWTNPKIGQFVTPVSSWTSTNVDTGTNKINIAAHGLRLGMPCMLGTFGTLPTGVDAATLYYVGVPDADHITLHATSADAIAGTSPIALTAAGAGVSSLVEQEPLVVHTFTNNQITFPVAAVVGMPSLEFSATATLFDTVTFECFRKNNAAWSDANSLYSVAFVPYAPSGPDPTLVKQQSYTAQWGAVAPFSSFTARGSIKVRFNLGLAATETDAVGIVSRKITSLTAAITCSPAGMSEDQLVTYLDLQGVGAARGAERTKNDFIVSGANGDVFARFYDAALRDVPEQFDATNPRAGELSWETSRKITAGVVKPVFAVGVTLPGA